MPDEIDIAQERTADYLERCVAAARGIPAPRAASPYCEGCGEEIPAARRMAAPGATRCVDCQMKHEREGI